MDANQNYRSFLRIASVVTAVVLVFQSGIVVDSTTGLFTETTEYLGATVGMSVSVQENELNTITAALTKQKQLLAQREAAVEEREIAVSISTGEVSSVNNESRTTYVLAAVLFVQLVLIVLNYGLDYVRARDHKLLRPPVVTG